ncbi:MAG: 3-methyl-2-oxobutanoate hydroxymethyltransferase [Rickettsiales bacterium]
MAERITLRSLRRMYERGEKWACLTAYAAPTATLLDPFADLLLVGDSVGTALYGYDSTLRVTLEMMVAHGEAVARTAKRAFVAVDLPFGTYQRDKYAAYDAAAKIMRETGCGAVKMEGGAYLADTVAFVAERGIPVIGHIGMQPQHKNSYGGFFCQGRDESSASAIIEDAQAIESAGAFAYVVEAVPEALARKICDAARVPVIGIGASPACDGQILVTEDMIGAERRPAAKFVRRYADVASTLSAAAERYVADVKSGAFPAKEETY